MSTSPLVAADWRLPFDEAVEIIRKGTWSRIGFALVVWPIASLILPALWLGAWVAAMAVWEFAVRPFLEDAIAAPAARRSEQFGFVWLAIINFVGGFGYSGFAFATWSTGEPLGMLIATGWVCGAANHLFVYFSSRRLLLLACLVPLLVCGIAAPFIVSHGVTMQSSVAAIVLLILVAAAGVFGYDRRALLQNLSKNVAARAAAESANVAKSQFMAIMSHELRTPLNSIIGYAELIAEEADGDVRADAAKIRDSARKLLSAVNIILDLSRLETGDVAMRREGFAAGAIVEQLRSDGAPLAAARGNSFTVREVGALGEARIDPIRLHQALMQLVSNAAKFTADGRIEVVASREARNGVDALVFVVADTGIGIAADQHARIFEPFVQVDQGADRAHEGAGLGLAFARQVARLMGGDVTVESAPAQGASFTLWVGA